MGYKPLVMKGELNTEFIGFDAQKIEFKNAKTDKVEFSNTSSPVTERSKLAYSTANVAAIPITQDKYQKYQLSKHESQFKLVELKADRFSKPDFVGSEWGAIDQEDKLPVTLQVLNPSFYSDTRVTSFIANNEKHIASWFSGDPRYLKTIKKKTLTSNPDFDYALELKKIEKREKGEESGSDKSDEPYLPVLVYYDEGGEIMSDIDRTELKPEDILNIFTDVAEGLDILHKREILHRNLSLQNIEVRRERVDKKDKYSARLQGFGFAKVGILDPFAEPELKQFLPSSITSTPVEILNNQGVIDSKEAELKSFALTLYHAMVGESAIRLASHALGKKQDRINKNIYNYSLSAMASLEDQYNQNAVLNLKELFTEILNASNENPLKYTSAKQIMDEVKRITSQRPSILRFIK